MSILDQIVQQKRLEVAEKKRQLPVSAVQRQPLYPRTPVSICSSLTKEGSSQVIAEFKRQSPSKGPINLAADVRAIINGYTQAGAAALSVLTESHFFMGGDLDFERARASSSLPILRKDFMIDPYQISESKAMGADAVLLIASILTRLETRDFARQAHDEGMEVLLEVHNSEELDQNWVPEIDLVGINNRNLSTFAVDPQTSFDLADSIPKGQLKISESAISSPELVQALKKSGFSGFLIGEYFMKKPDPGLALEAFIHSVRFLESR